MPYRMTPSVRHRAIEVYYYYYSVLGPILFSVFTSSVGHIISSSGIHHQQYADDTQLFISLTSSGQYDSIGRLERCLLTLHEW